MSEFFSVNARCANFVGGGVYGLGKSHSKRQACLNCSDESIEVVTYRIMQRDILSEKNAVKAEIERLQRTATSSWIEPAKDVINTLQSLAGMEFSASLLEIATLVRKIGSNRQISRKTVAFSFAEPCHSVQYSQGFREFCHAENRLEENDPESERQGWCAVEVSNL